jgi:hypothetical protein
MLAYLNKQALRKGSKANKQEIEATQVNSISLFLSVLAS